MTPDKLQRIRAGVSALVARDRAARDQEAADDAVCDLMLAEMDGVLSRPAPVPAPSVLPLPAAGGYLMPPTPTPDATPGDLTGQATVPAPADEEPEYVPQPL